MSNTILFFTSELDNRFENACCNDLYKTIDRHLTVHKAKSYFTLFKYDQPTGEQILEKIAENPAYIQYCGHGGEEGEIQLIDGQGRVYSLPVDSLKRQLEQNFNLECLFLGSCNSDKLLAQLMDCAEYSVGFTESPKAEFVNAFYDKFYARLVYHGSPYKAFLEAREKLKVNRTISAGPQVIFRSKNNLIMELIELEGASVLEKAKLSNSDQRLSDRLNKLASLKAQADAISQELLRSHPFAPEVVEFSTFKKKLSHDLAYQILAGEEPSKIEAFERKFAHLLDIVQDVIVAYEERKSAKVSLIEIGKRLPKDTTEKAFKLLLKNNEIQGMHPEFQKLLDISVAYCAKVVRQA
ncbi:MAG: hypothetical protein JNN28_11570 [Saprospiraceae bacterium]|nr:hypothetical protein [Saprospiraceae bacterium]